METIGRIICYGTSIAPANLWHCTKHIGINRLYYIHSGSGGYIHNGKKYPFLPNHLYYISYTANFTPFCDIDDPIKHTYIDFEMIPPFITKEILYIEAKNDLKLLSALSVFTSGGEMSNHRDLSALHNDRDFFELNKMSVIYLINQIAQINKVKKISDEVIIKSLEIIHKGLHDKLTVKELAHKCYMSTDGFIRHFQRIVGTTPHAYIKNIRLRTARCLRESGMSVSQIANEVGYSDASSLLHALQNEEIQSKQGEKSTGKGA